MELYGIEEHRSRKALDSAALHRGYFLSSHAERMDQKKSNRSIAWLRHVSPKSGVQVGFHRWCKASERAQPYASFHQQLLHGRNLYWNSRGRATALSLPDIWPPIKKWNGNKTKRIARYWGFECRAQKACPTYLIFFM